MINRILSIIVMLIVMGAIAYGLYIMILITKHDLIKHFEDKEDE